MNGIATGKIDCVTKNDSDDDDDGDDDTMISVLRSDRTHREQPASPNLVHQPLLNSESHRAVSREIAECRTATENIV